MYNALRPTLGLINELCRHMDIYEFDYKYLLHV